jgi:hypothetical protein
MLNNEIYISTDIESNGPIPGPNSMLSFGSAAFIIEENKSKQLSTFYVNLELMKDSNPDPDTMQFWEKNKEAYNLTRTDLMHPRDAMKKYHTWINSLPGKSVFVGYPVAFDFIFIYWYLMKFVGNSPFSHSALDVKTYAMSMLRKPYRASTKKNMPKSWFDGCPKHTHHALDDAIEQGTLFCNMLITNLS